MPLKNSIISLRVEIFKELEATFGHYRTAELHFAVEAVEEFLRLTLRASLLKMAQAYAPEANYSEETYLLVTDQGLLELAIAETALSRRTLDVAFVLYNFNQKTPSYVEKLVQQDGFGRYSLCRVHWPSSVPVAWDGLIEIIEAVVTTIYSWLENFVTAGLNEVETKLSSALYSYARATFECDPALLRRFWFVAVRGQKGYCLFDQRLASEAVAIAVQGSKGTALVAADVSANFVANEADFELMIAKDSISQGECIDVPFAATHYRAVAVDFSRAEVAIHGTDSITLFPIVKEGTGGYLLAGFPTPKRSVFEPLLKHHLDEIVTIFRNHADALRQLETTMLKMSGVTNIGRIGQFIGGFTKGFIDS